MQIRIKGKNIYTYSWKRLLYALCFFLFCVIDQRTKTIPGRWVFRDLTGVVMAIVIMSHYRVKDFLKWKIPYLVWTTVWIIGVPVACFFRNAQVLLDDWLVIALGVVLFGYILIHTVISVVIEKTYPKLNVKFGVVWLGMMLWMVLVRTYIWPFCYLVMFGCFYLTDSSREEQEDLFQGMLDGVILGFFVLQGLCFVFRPYDEARYSGFYSNSNNNSLFYLLVLVAVFVKILHTSRIGANKWVKAYYWVGAGVLLSFELLTIGRTGWFTAVLLVVAFLIFYEKYQGVKRWGKHLLKLVLCVCVTFPLCFCAVRYLPPLFHHPVWFSGEWSEERVHSWDPWNSPKYVDLDEYFEAALGRIWSSIENLQEHSPLLLTVSAAEDMPGNETPKLEKEQIFDSILVRGSIYSYYFKHLKLWGQPYSEQGFWLTEDYWVWHTHNIYLQYGTDFGIPAMILFAVLIGWGVIRLGKRFAQDGMETDACAWLYLMLPAFFGLLDYSWGAGSLSILLLFIAWKRVMCEKL